MYKLTLYGFPVWPITFVDPKTKRGIAATYLVGRTGTAELLQGALQDFKSKISKFFDSPRIFMIDHDAAERAAIAKLGCRYLLCEFHVAKVFIIV